MGLLTRAVVLSCILPLIAVGTGMAQECLGYTTHPGQVSLNPGVTLADHTTTFGAVVNAQWAEPLGFEAGIGITSYDHELIESIGLEFSGRVGYELGIRSASVCAFTGLAYSRVVADEPTLSGLTVPLGIGLGRTIAVGSKYHLTLSGAPQLLYFRQMLEWSLESESESDVELGLSLAALLGTGRIYGRFSWALSLLGDRYNGIGISMGLRLGR